MAVILNTKFDPFSYEELVRPAMEMTLAHQEVEQGLAELESQAAEWETKANRETDPIAHSRYMNYARDLKMQAHNLATRGLNAQSRKQLYNMSSRYNQDIKPISEAFEQRKVQALLQQQQKGQDSTMMFDRDAGSTSLDEYLANPSLSYRNFSGATLQAMATAAATKLAQELKSFGKTGSVDAYTDIITAKYGLTSEEVALAIADPTDPRANKALTAIINEVLDASDIKSWNNPAALEEAMGYINNGLYHAIGTNVPNLQENWGARKKKEFEYQMAAQNDQQAHELLKQGRDHAHQEKMAGLSGSGKGKGTGSEGARTLTQVSSDVLSLEELKTNNPLAPYIDGHGIIKYFTTDEKGNINMTEKGKYVLKQNDIATALEDDLGIPAYNSGNVSMSDKNKYTHLSIRNGTTKEYEYYKDKLADTGMSNTQIKLLLSDFDPSYVDLTFQERYDGNRSYIDNYNSAQNGNKYDLAQYSMLTTEIQDNDKRSIMADISTATTGDMIPVYSRSANGQFIQTDDMDKEDLNKYSPRQIVITKPLTPTMQALPYIKLMETTDDGKFKTNGDVIFVPANMNSQHMKNYTTAANAYFASTQKLLEYNKDPKSYKGDLEEINAINDYFLNPNSPYYTLRTMDTNILGYMSRFGATNLNALSDINNSNLPGPYGY